MADDTQWGAPAGTTIVPSWQPATGKRQIFKPNAAWWNKQFRADPRSLRIAPGLAARQNTTAADYGYYVARGDNKQPLYKTAAGASGIQQVVDADGNPILDDKGQLQYKDAAGNAYGPADLVLDIRRVERGQSGYLGGALGAAEAGSEQNQFRLADASAAAGVGKSGMRAAGAGQETAALQSALSNIARRAGTDFNTIQNQYADLYDAIYKDLVAQAGDFVVEEPTVEEAPAAPALPPGVQAVPGGGTVNPQGQYTPPPPGTPLSAEAFNNTLNEILGPPSMRGPQPMTKLDRIRALRNIYDTYTLTDAQRARVKAELKTLGFIIR